MPANFIVIYMLFLQGIYEIYIFCNKWKNHLFEMKRDVGMADHEKGRKQGVAYPTPTSLVS